MTVKSKGTTKNRSNVGSKKPSSRLFYDAMTLKEHTKVVRLISDALAPQCGCYADFLRDATPNDIINLEVDYNKVDVFEAAALRQLMALYQKDASLTISGVNKELVAVGKFLATEIKCRHTNNRLRNLERVRSIHEKYVYSADKPNPVNEFIRTCSEIIRVIVGDCPDYEDIPFKFGPGSSTTVRDRTTVPFKLAATPVCAKEAILSGAVHQLLATVPRYYQIYGTSLRFGMGHLNFVSKNALAHRTMIIEPLINTAAQIGIGTILKSRFKKSVGIDLKMQWQINKALAQLGSAKPVLNGVRLATIDFSSASDLICYLLILYLFPLSWFNLLSNWRTGTVCYKKGGVTSYELEKFSSMGNGYTFELESIVFYAMALAVIGRKNRIYDPVVIIEKFSKNVSIFGDDLIVPSKYYSGILWASQALGFKINQSKTYTKGPFRESCGGDYFKGIQIGPFYIKDLFTSARIVGYLNHDIRNSFGGLLPEETRAQLIALIPKRDRLYGPDGYGDGHIVVHRPELKRFDKPSIVNIPLHSYGIASFKLRDGTNRFFFETLKKKTISHPLIDENTDRTTYLTKMYDTQFFHEDSILFGSSDPYLMIEGTNVTRVRIMVPGPLTEVDDNLPAEVIPCVLPVFRPLPYTEWPYLHIRASSAMFIKPNIV